MILTFNSRLGIVMLYEKESRITLKNEDDSVSFLTLVYDANGANWCLEKIKEK